MSPLKKMDEEKGKRSDRERDREREGGLKADDMQRISQSSTGARDANSRAVIIGSKFYEREHRCRRFRNANAWRLLISAAAHRRLDAGRSILSRVKYTLINRSPPS